MYIYCEGKSRVALHPRYVISYNNIYTYECMCEVSIKKNIIRDICIRLNFTQ